MRGAHLDVGSNLCGGAKTPAIVRAWIALMESREALVSTCKLDPKNRWTLPERARRR